MFSPHKPSSLLLVALFVVLAPRLVYGAADFQTPPTVPPADAAVTPALTSQSSSDPLSGCAGPVVVIDLTNKANGWDTLSNRLWTSPKLSADLVLNLQKFFPNASPTTTDQAALHNALVSSAGQRLITPPNNKGQHVTTIVVFNADDGKEPVLKVDQKTRDTVLLDNLRTVIKTVVTAKFGTGQQQPSPLPAATVRVLFPSNSCPSLDYRRGTISIAAKTRPKPTVSEVIDDNSCNANDCLLKKVDISYGPAEHWMLSLDLPITKASQLKYDSSTGKVSPKTVPTTFYGGVDFAFGDVVAEPTKIDFSSVLIKAFVKVSGHPSDSFGGGIGFRPPGEFFGLKLDLFEIFGAYIVTRQQTQPIKSNSYHGSAQLGVSFNVSQLASWLGQNTGAKKSN